MTDPSTSSGHGVLTPVLTANWGDERAWKIGNYERRGGYSALRTALRLAAGEKLDSHHVELATMLVVRDSTAALG